MSSKHEITAEIIEIAQTYSVEPALVCDIVDRVACMIEVAARKLITFVEVLTESIPSNQANETQMTDSEKLLSVLKAYEVSNVDKAEPIYAVCERILAEMKS